MALSSSAVLSQIEASLSSFNNGNTYSKTGEMLSAIAGGVVEAITANGIVNVNAHAGSVYVVEGVSSALIESAIVSKLTSFTFSGTHAKGEALPKAVSKAVSIVISSASQIKVPVDGVGAYPITGVSSNAISAVMKSEFLAAGFKLNDQFCKTLEMINAISDVIASSITSSAQVFIDGVKGGVFKVV